MKGIDEFHVKIKSARFNIYNSGSGNSYTVIKHNDLWNCDCKSFQFCIEPATCKHIDEIKNDLEELVPDYDSEEEEE